MDTYNWITLLYTQITVNQLYSIIKVKSKQKENQNPFRKKITIWHDGLNEFMPKCYKWSQIVTASFSLVGIVSVGQESSKKLQNFALSASKVLPTNVPVDFSYSS